MDSFFGIGLFELVLIAVIALVVLGPERLPGAMREVAKYMRQLRQISGEFQSQFSEELQMLDEINPKRIIDDAIKPAPGAKPAPRQPNRPATTAVPGARPSAAPVTSVETRLPTPTPVAPAASAETQNSILPPAASAPAPGATGPASAAQAPQDDAAPAVEASP